MQKQVLHNQNILDFTLHHTGTLLGLMDVVFENKLELSDTVVTGQIVTIPNSISVDKDIKDYFYYKKHIPATSQKIKNAEPIEFAYEFAIQF